MITVASDIQLIAVAAALVYIFISRPASIVIDEGGITIGGSYNGPFRNTDPLEFTDFLRRPQLTLPWNKIASLRLVIYTSRTFTVMFNAAWQRYPYLVIETDDHFVYVVRVWGSLRVGQTRWPTAVVDAVSAAGYRDLLGSEPLNI